VTAFEYYQQMLDLRFQPDRKIVDTLLLACSKNRDIDNALTIFHNNYVRGDLVPGAHSYSVGIAFDLVTFICVFFCVTA
jgi:hypothetical protein